MSSLSNIIWREKRRWPVIWCTTILGNPFLFGSDPFHLHILAVWGYHAHVCVHLRCIHTLSGTNTYQHILKRRNSWALSILHTEHRTYLKVHILKTPHSHKNQILIEKIPLITTIPLVVLRSLATSSDYITLHDIQQILNKKNIPPCGISRCKPPHFQRNKNSKGSWRNPCFPRAVFPVVGAFAEENGKNETRDHHQLQKDWTSSVGVPPKQNQWNTRGRFT